MTKRDGRRSNVAIRGVGELARELRGNVEVVEGRWFRPGLAELVVGSGIAGQIQNLKVGDRPKIRGLEWTVVGRFTAGGQAFESEVWGDIEDCRKQFKRDYSGVLLRTEKPEDLDRLARVIKDDKRLALDAKPQPEYYVDQNQAAQMIKAMGVVLAFVLSIGALFGAANTMYAAVAVRTREVATMRVLGFTRAEIWLSFVFESALLGLAGGVAGSVVAYLAFNGISTGTVNWVSFSEMAFKFRVSPGLMGAAVGLAVLMGVGGGFLPAWRASRAPIARALRGL
jgi:ABC-type lipoprotein release transport system permease subunit